MTKMELKGLSGRLVMGWGFGLSIWATCGTISWAWEELGEPQAWGGKSRFNVRHVRSQIPTGYPRGDTEWTAG